jgi:hypothetical protein
LGTDHAQTLRIRYHIARISRLTGTTYAEPALRDTADRLERLLGRHHPHTIDARLECVLHARDSRGGELDRTQLIELLEGASTSLGGEHPTTRSVRDLLNGLG